MTQRQHGSGIVYSGVRATMTMTRWPQGWAGFHTRLSLSFSYLCAQKSEKREGEPGDMAR